tara:strand:- start:1149 stop:1463 length:315 start_codon:yes stop_codon:yes gene_type:complete
MSVKLAILQDKEHVIAEIKELVDDGKPVGFLFSNPHRVSAEKQFLAESEEDRSVQVTLSPWILLTADKEILVPKHHVVTMVEPLDSIKQMYSEKVNGSESSSTD